MKTSEFLEKAKGLIDTPEKHTKGVFARDKEGVKTPSDYQNAVCFCSLGALRRTLNNHPSDENIYHSAFRNLQNRVKSMGHSSIPDFNDDFKTKHSDVMKVFDDSIQSLKAQGK